jgi:uncharacterized protein YecE (DUF72 family)
MAQIYVGTSGFAYATWKPDFYPEDLPSRKFLEHYASRLNSTEVNYTFRRLPTASTLNQWIAATPADFMFSVKAHMKLTHVLKLRGCEEFLDRFLTALEPLRAAGRLGPILVQLPPSFKKDEAALGEFLALLRPEYRFTFEFRHTSWLVDSVYEQLKRVNAALCGAESERLVIPHVLTAPFMYLRLRKPAGYSDSELEEIAREARELVKERDVYLYLKHEDEPTGPLQAEDLRKRLLAPGA